MKFVQFYTEKQRHRGKITLYLRVFVWRFIRVKSRVKKIMFFFS